MFWPLLLYLRARACARAGKPEQGLGFIDRGIELAAGAGTLPSLLYVMKGELLLALPDADAGEAAGWLQRGYDGAFEFGARMHRLRAAIGLCRAELALDGAKHATELLRATYAEFTEGHETPDLTEAAALLQAT